MASWEVFAFALIFMGYHCYVVSTYLKQIQILCDKLMSRNFHEYEQTKNPPPEPEVRLEPMEAQEDMSLLNGIGIT